MRLLRAILLALLPCVTAAQLLPVSNVVIRGGIAPGYTELQTNGMIRWNPAVTNLQVFDGNSWTNIAGGGGGSGAGFPLTNSPFANAPGSNTTFGVFDFGFLSFLGSTNTLYFNTNNGTLYFGSDPVGSGFGSGFPLTNNADASNFDITNINTLVANQIKDLDYIDFNQPQTNLPVEGRLYWNPDRETLVLGLENEIEGDVMQTLFAFVRNEESFTLDRGTVVYLSGSAGELASVRVASYSNDAVSARSLGIVAENIGANQTGLVVTRGVVRKIDTSAYPEGSILWLGAYGNLQTNRPIAPDHNVFIGIVERSNAGNGSIYVAVQNGFELEELHDVNVSGRSVNDLILWQGTVWTNYSRTNFTLQADFVAASNNIDSRLTSLNTNVQARLASNVWASADSTTNYMPRTGGIFTGPVTGTAFNVSTLEVTNNFRYRGTNALTKAYLMHDGTNIAFQYAPREIWNASRFASAITNNETIYPGQQLLWPNILNFQQRDDMFQLKQEISPLVFTNQNYPTPANGAFWDLVLRQGRDGATGPKGDDGLANVFFQGVWSATNAAFTFSSTSTTWVSYQGQIYRLLQNSSALTPPDTSPSTWAVDVSRGADGIVTAVSNLVDRGVWNSFTAYTNLDLVVYAGNTFYSDSTNQPPGTNRVPVLNSDGIGQSDAYWTIRTQRGAKGLQGIAGKDGIDGVFTTNVFNEFTSIVFDTNNFFFVNTPTATNRIPVFTQTINDTNYYEWASYTPVGTNNLTVSNNLLYLNGNLAGGSARLTSAWSIVYSDADTNSVSLPLGASNTVLRSTGSSSAPIWAVLDDLSWKLAPISANYTSVAYNFVLADTAASDILITLPSASVNSGKVVAARKMSNSNTLYVRAPSGNLVQGVGTVGVVRAGSVIEVISTGGTNWWLK